MGITLPIGSKLDETQARRTANQAEDFFSTAGRRAGDEFSRQVNQGLGRVDTTRSRTQAALLERAFDKAADAAGKLRIEEAKLDAVQASGSATRAQLITHSERVERARRAEARATREAANAVREFHDSTAAFSAVGSAASGAASGISSVGAAASRLGGPVMAAGAVVLADGLVNLTGIAVSAAQSMWLLPSAFGAAAAGVGTLKIATLGFSDVLKDLQDPKKFAEGIQGLAPNAQQAALEIQAMMPELKKLQMAAQDALFADSAPMLSKLSAQYLPVVNQLTTGIAGAFNNAWRGVGAELMTSGVQSDITRFVDNTVDAFNKLSGVTGPLTHALSDLVAVGSDFLPGLASGATDAATAFSNFISNAKESGKLHEWIQDGLDTVEKLGKVLWNAGDAIVKLSGRGTEYLPGLADSFKSLADNIDTVASSLTGVVNGLDLVRKITTGDLTAISDIRDYVTGAQSFTGHRPSQTSSGPTTTPSVPRVFGPPSPSIPQMLPVPGDPTALAPTDLGGLLGGGGAPPTTADYRAWYGNNDRSKRDVPAPPPDRGRGGGAPRQVLPTVPYSGADPMSLLTGFSADASLYSAAGTVLDNQQKVAQARSDLATLEKSGTATQSEIIAKKNELQRAEREQHEAELRLIEAKQQATNKTLKVMQSTHDAMSTLGAGLDQDLGISKGLPGLADNLVRFIGHLAAAPLQAQLEAISKANPSQGGYGLMGTLAAQGVFGPDYTGVGPTAGPSTYPTTYPGMAPGYGGQPYGLPAGTNTGGYGSSGAVFPQWVHALEQAFGVKASTYAGHQESDRNEPGYAPNPMHQNRGIDWTGSADAMQRFANYMAGQPNAEQVIYQNPLTGQNTEAVAGQPRPGYFAGDLPAHQNHVHTRQAQSIPTPTMDPYGVVNAGPMYPGTGYPNALPGTQPLGTVGPAASVFAGAQNPTQIGAVVPAANGIGGGGIGMSQGGLLDLATQVGGAGLDMLAPGAGQAAQTLIKLGNRAIQFGGQAAGIGVQGLMETFLPTGGSQLAQSNWATRLIGGLAGALPAIPNMAGKKAPDQPQGGQGQRPGNTTNITHNTTINAEGRDNGGLIRDWEANTLNAAMTPISGP